MSATGSSFKLLHTFTGTTGSGIGANPYYGELIANGPGTFIGTTYGGGLNSVGEIFKLTVPVARPVLTVTQKPPKKTTASKFTFKGKVTAQGGVKAVQYRVNSGAYKTAKGSNAPGWFFTASLKPGKNVITIRARDGLGQTSALKRYTVTRN